jgi:oxidase EvaA
MSITYELIRSWKDKTGNVNSMEDIFKWVEFRNQNLTVDIQKIPFSYEGFWHYDDATGYIRNANNSFFQLAGYQGLMGDKVVREQPVILQREVGFLGILCQMIDGKLNFLMQAKVEPGNVNVIQISPTIQATKSNFTQKHGGAVPAYLEFFKNARKHTIIVDQLQSEQASRFLGKRNRNIIIYVKEDVKLAVLPSHKWMTLGQIKECMRHENLVNMDSRTVLSCIPLSRELLELDELADVENMFEDKAFFASVFGGADHEKEHIIFNSLNDYKMLNDAEYRTVPLKALKNWKMTPLGIECKTPYDFKVIYCNIEIEGREVRKWEQPLVEATGIALFGCLTAVDNGVRKYLVKIKPEVGSFDGAELGPTVQLESLALKNKDLNAIDSFFLEQLEKKRNVLFDNLLSEEGGRFYHEQNRNVIIEIDSSEEIGSLPDGYFWVDYATINHMIQFNNVVNIQLRNIMALMEI